MKIGQFSMLKSPKCFVTTPIYYVNASPHIGHLSTSLLADAIQRWRKIVNPNTFIKFSTGTDEHGSKVEKAALNNSNSVEEYCDRISQKYKDLSDNFNINYTDFIRTTEQHHCRTVQKFWNVLKERGHINYKNYEGWYCVPDETFLKKSQIEEKISPDGQIYQCSMESGHPVEWQEEMNYVFPLSKFIDDVKHWILTNESSIQPPVFKKILLDLVCSDKLSEISISRPRSRVPWSIPVPDDESQSIYVWFDALINYLTVSGYGSDHTLFEYLWPPDVQVIGKDILKFHGVYWPAFLIAAGLEPPRSLFCHSHWTVDDLKMSKSKNNVVCPFQQSEIFSMEGLRYFILRMALAHRNTNYTEKKVRDIINAELADTIGNLLCRCCGTALNPKQIFPFVDPEFLERFSAQDDVRDVLEKIRNVPETCRAYYDQYDFKNGVNTIMYALQQINHFFDSRQPWKLKNDPNKIDELNSILQITMNALVMASILLQPIAPNLTTNLLDKLSIPENCRTFSSLETYTWNNSEYYNRQLDQNKSSVLIKKIRTASG